MTIAGELSGGSPDGLKLKVKVPSTSVLVVAKPGTSMLAPATGTPVTESVSCPLMLVA